MRMYPAALQNDLAKFFENLFPDSTMHRKHAGELFDRVVERHIEGLLNENVPYTQLHDSALTTSELYQQNPEMALAAIQLFTRAVAAKKQEHLAERKIDVRRMLAERVRLVKAKGIVNNLRRRII
jgi:hypothetical protein